MSARMSDRTRLGIVIRQDHREDVEPSRRAYPASARIVDPTSDEWRAFEIEEVDGQGTAGDDHPWAYWAPEGGEGGERGIGSWYPAMASESQGGVPKAGGGGVTTPSGGSGTNPEGRDHPVFRAGGATNPRLGLGDPAEEESGHAQDLLPIRYADYSSDERYALRTTDQPEYLQLYPKGFRVISMAGTHEGAQEDLVLPADGRLVAVQSFKHKEMGTIVSDLVAEGELGSEGPYGVGARDAALQTLAWVVRLPALGKLQSEEANAVALTGTRTNQGKRAGFVPVVGRPIFGGPAGEPQDSPGQSTPITPSGGIQTGDTEAGRNPEGRNHPVFRSAGGAVPPGARDGGPGGGGGRTQGAGQASFGGTGVGFLMHEAGGPLNVGFRNDIHEHDKSKDDQGINPLHIHIDALWNFEQGQDGPHEHSLEPYPDPAKVGYWWYTDIFFDPREQHRYLDGTKPGKWRRATIVPILTGGDEPREPEDPPPTDDPPTREPRDPPITPREPQDPPTPTPDVPTPTTPRSPDAPGDIGGGDRGGGGTIPNPSTPGPVGNGEGPITISVLPFDHSSYAPQLMIDLPMQTGFGTQVWRAQPTTDGVPDLRYHTPAQPIAKAERDRRPVIHRVEAVGIEQASGEFDYYRKHHESRNVGGESNGGGIWSLPAPFDVLDAVQGSYPHSEYAETYRGFGDGVCVAFGFPSVTQGVADGGMVLKREGGGVKLLEMSSGALAAHTPTHDRHLVDKAYVDSAAGGPAGTYGIPLIPLRGTTGTGAWIAMPVVALDGGVVPDEPYVLCTGVANTRTSTVGMFEMWIPPGFDASSNTITIRVRADVTAASNTGDGLAVEAYLNGGGSNLVTTSPAVIGGGAAWYSYTVNPSGRTAGERLVLYVKYNQDDTGGGGGGNTIQHLAIEQVIA